MSEPMDDVDVSRQVRAGKLVKFDPEVHGHRRERDEVLAQLRANVRAWSRPKLRQEVA